jgi:hypothetical protein
VSEIAISVTVNGERHELRVPPWETLLECLPVLLRRALHQALGFLSP